MKRQPHIVGIGEMAMGASSTEQALALPLKAARCRASVRPFGEQKFAGLPYYLTAEAGSSPTAVELLESIWEADGLIIASLGYYGSISGLLKNAIDYFEGTVKDLRPYLRGVPVGLIATAYGWQATGSTLATLRSIAHALRGWPTPFGAAINTSGGVLKDGTCADAAVGAQLDLIGEQVCEFAMLKLIQPRSFTPEFG